ncbi:MAG: VanZ family protein [bacterium]|nr:VanZ family protein [bacterium]
MSLEQPERHFWEAAAVIWTAVVFSMAITPFHNVELITESLSDKLLHTSAFLVGSIVWAGTLERNAGPWRSVGLAISVCLVLGGVIEALQSQTATRQAEAGDLVADAVGVVVGALLWGMRVWLRERRASSHPEPSVGSLL